nr:hypothetical protein [Tanacetum cinerariifolium]
MENPEESAVNEGTLPEGRSIRSSLPTHAVGNLLEAHEFFCHFKDVLKLEEPLSIEDLEKELACTEQYGDEPPGKLLANIGSAAQVKLDMLPINQLTWPEVVRRYIMAYLLVEGKMHSQHKKRHNKTNIIRCLLGDGGIFCDSPTVIAGVESDAKKMELIPEWVTALKPALSLPTNVGSRIRSCVHEALKKDPPEWAKKELENSIAKDVYKGNASGPTKNAVREVIKRAEKMHREHLMILCHVSAIDTEKVLSDLVGGIFNSEGKNLRVIFKSKSTRPLDLRTMKSRFLHGTYGDSHEAFLEDFREAENSLLVAPLVRSLLRDNNIEVTVEVEKLEDLSSIEIPKTPWEMGICKVCCIDKDDDMVLLCDVCDAEYHTYCLNPPLSIFQFVDLKLEEASRFKDYLTASEAKEYMELEADKIDMLLICSSSYVMSPYTRMMYVNISMNLEERQLSVFWVATLLKDYWGFPHTSTHYGIVVYQNAVLENTGLTSHAPPRNEDHSSWSVFQSHEQIENLLNGKNLLESHAARSSNTKSSHLLYCLDTKATGLLKSKYELQLERDVGTSSKRQRKCLTVCNNELVRHKISPCNQFRSSDNVSSSEITSSALAPKPSQKPLAGKALHALKQLKINLLDMEAALPDQRGVNMLNPLILYIRWLKPH